MRRKWIFAVTVAPLLLLTPWPLQRNDGIAALAHELGYLGGEFLEDAIKDDYGAALERRGLNVGQFNMLVSDDGTRDHSRRILADRPLPEGFRIVEIDRDSDPALMLAFQRLNDDCGVATLPAYVLRGESMPVVASLMQDGNGEAAATAGCNARHPPGSRFAGSVWTGLLATRPDLRGRRIRAGSDAGREEAESGLDLRQDREPAILGSQDVDAESDDVTQEARTPDPLYRLDGVNTGGGDARIQHEIAGSGHHTRRLLGIAGSAC